MDKRKSSTIYMKTLMEKRKRTIKTHNLFQSSTTLESTSSDALIPLSNIGSDVPASKKSNRAANIFDSNGNIFDKGIISLSNLPISTDVSGNHLDDTSPLHNTIDLTIQELPNRILSAEEEKKRNEEIVMKRTSLPVLSFNLKNPKSSDKLDPLSIGIKPPVPRKSMVSSLIAGNSTRYNVSPPSYQDLIRKTSLVKNSLIAYSSSDNNNNNSRENSATTKKISYAQKTSNAIQIQSVVRRYLILHKYGIYEKKRIEQRYLIMKQSMLDSENFLILYNNNNNNNNKLFYYYMNMASQELDKIINQIKNKNISDVKRSDLLLFIYNLIDTSKNSCISRSQYRQLVLYIFKFSISKSVLNNDLNKIDPQYRNLIPFNTFISYMNKYIKSGSVLGYLEQKISCYDVKNNALYKEIVKEILKLKCKKLFSKINLDAFDRKNPPLFICSNCKNHFVYPLDYGKHVINCKKNN